MFWKKKYEDLKSEYAHWMWWSAKTADRHEKKIADLEKKNAALLQDNQVLLQKLDTAKALILAMKEKYGWF